ncbi:MAG: ATP-dependent helicase [Bacteroidia bacterium]|nr:ATP-dependent helicase [Bacteroidia bacterium]
MKIIFLQFYFKNVSKVALAVLDQNDKKQIFLTNDLLDENLLIEQLNVLINKESTTLFYLVSEKYLEQNQKFKDIVKKYKKAYSLNHDNVKKYYHLTGKEQSDVHHYITMLHEKLFRKNLNNLENLPYESKIEILNKIIGAVNFEEIITGQIELHPEVKNYIESIHDFNFSIEQKLSLNKFYDFIIHDGSAIYLLTGSAGTGKSTLVNYLLDFYRKKFDNSSYKLITPTGKSARVLESKTKVTCHTLHKTIYTFRQNITETKPQSISRHEMSGSKEIQLSLFTEYELSHIDNIEIVEIQSLSESPHSVHFIVVDEASMMSDFEHEIQVKNEKERMEKNHKKLVNCTGFHLYDLLKYMEQTKINVKIILLGDHCQLPPVITGTSKKILALDADFISKKYSNYKLFISHLTEAHRFANDEIYLFSIFLRNKIEKSGSGVFHANKVIFKQLVNEFHLLNTNVTLPIINDIEFFFNKYIDDLKNNISCIMITHRNAYSNYINYSIRKKLNKTRALENGDKCISVKNNYKYGIMNGEHFEIMCVNDVIFREVLNFYSRTSHIIPFYKADIKLEQTGEIFKDVILTFQIDDLYYPINLGPNESVVDTKLKSMTNINYLIKQEFKSRMKYEFFKKLVNDVANFIKENNIKHFNLDDIRAVIVKYDITKPEDLWKIKITDITKDFKELLNKYILDRISNDPFLNSLIFMHSYSITCHKAQGSEWENVYVTDISKNDIKWLYTATTRAKSNIYFYDCDERIPKTQRPFMPISRILKNFQGIIRKINEIRILSTKEFLEEIKLAFCSNHNSTEHEYSLYSDKDTNLITLLITENEIYFSRENLFEKISVDEVLEKIKTSKFVDLKIENGNVSQIL